jgi:hypothetical protein
MRSNHAALIGVVIGVALFGIILFLLTRESQTAAPVVETTPTPAPQPSPSRSVKSVGRTQPKPTGSTTAVPSVAPTPHGYEVELSSTPSQAMLVADNDEELTCRAPCKLALKPGRHTLKAVLPGNRDALKIIQVPPDLEVHIAMQAMAGRVFAESAPEGATIVVDGNPIPEKTPANFTLPAGTHNLEIRLGGRVSRSTLEVKDGAIHRISATLE